MAVSMAFGPDEALGLVGELADSGRLDEYHLLPAVRGDLLQKMGRYDEAKAEFERAASLTGNEVEREVMLARAGECSG